VAWKHAAAATNRSDLTWVDSAGLIGVARPPTFFADGRPPHGAYDFDTIARTVRAAGAQATLVG